MQPNYSNNFQPPHDILVHGPSGDVGSVERMEESEMGVTTIKLKDGTTRTDAHDKFRQATAEERDIFVG